MKRLLYVLLLLLSMYVAKAQEKKVISGTVLDEKDHPLVGVTIQEKNTSNGAATDAGGKFKLTVSPTAILIFSYVGYLKQELPVTDQTLYTIKLLPDTKGLSEVVVTALGIKKQTRSLGYAVSTVSAKEITESGSTNFASALYGKAAGVKIISAPGGASSAVSVQVRGVSSVGLSTQPLYIVDGVPLRNFNDLTSGSFGTTNSRIDANGILDINPEDIESLTVLKGASATALYGSEATNGVVVITTKKGTISSGLGVEVNYVFNQEQLAAKIDYQTDYGPGYDAQTNVANGLADANGWITDADGAVHPYYRAYGQFGPKFDRRMVRYWDGSTRIYEAHKNNYKKFYQTGYNSAANVAVSNAGDKGSFRFSYNRIDYKSIMPGSNLYKNNFNFNGTLKLGEKVSIDLVSTYNNTYTHNRPTAMHDIFASYSGYFSAFDDMTTYFNKYKTSNGYKYVAYNNNSYDQNEKLLYNIRATNLMDFLYNNLRNNLNETQNRFINSATLNVALLKNLRLRGRFGGDFTNLTTVDEEHNTQPASLGYTGAYGITLRNNNVFYGDALAVYSPKLTKDLDLSVTGGYTARKQNFRILNSATSGGLVDENWFTLTNSAGTITSSSSRAEQMDIAGFGMLNLNYKNKIFLEGTGRYESTSTLPPAVNNYFYPSVNASVILSELLKMPAYVDFVKLRASFGLVGNHPNLYQANVAYNPFALTYNNASLLYQQANGKEFGNDQLKSEKKREIEFGLEGRLLEDKLTFDFSYYNNKVMDQIIFVSTPSASGAVSAINNAGDLSNYGFEAALTATPVATKTTRWITRFNFAVNRNKLTALPNGETSLLGTSINAGYLIIRSQVGDPLGNIYTYPRNTDANGNAIINADGFYTVNTNAYKYAGNIMPKVVGGFANSISYKNFSVDFTLDYRIGGKLVSVPTYYQIGAGRFKSTLQYRDAAHGGIAYDVISDANANYVASPNGARHDGVILQGVTSTGAPNTKVITAGMYYLNTFNFESDGLYEYAVFDNSYIKFREITISYNLPRSITQKMHIQGLQVALIGRNLFYIWKTLPYGLDPEVAVGSSWLSQGIDDGTTAPTRSMGASLRARF